MDFNTLKHYANAAKSDPGEYTSGYVRGLRRHYHGDNFGTEDEHNNWLNCGDSYPDRARGYLDGFNGKPPPSLHGNTGNKHAAAVNPKTSTLTVRCDSQDKAAWVRAAAGKKLTSWVIRTLNTAAKQSPD